MRVRSSGGETRIVVPSAAGRDLGLFLVFFGLVAPAPALYIYESLYVTRFIQVNDWNPAIRWALLVIVVGLLFMFNTHKRIVVKDHAVEVRDGFWRRTLHFTWKDPAVIKLRNIERELGHRVLDIWQIKLASQGYEYLLDARPDQQLVSRRLAEALTRAVGCDLVELEDKSEIVIAAKDLDLPMRARVQKYPQLLGSLVAAPADLRGLQVDERKGLRSYHWGLRASWLLVEILLLVLVGLVLSFVSWPGDSIWQQAISTNNYWYYYSVLTLMVVTLTTLPGYQVRIAVGEQDHVVYRVTIWGIPIEVLSLPLEQVEEIRQHEGMRGPVVQIISDKRIITFRVSDRQVARWIAYELGAYISGHAPIGRDEK